MPPKKAHIQKVHFLTGIRKMFLQRKKNYLRTQLVLHVSLLNLQKVPDAHNVIGHRLLHDEAFKIIII